MDALVLDFGAIDASMVPLVGGKAANLGELTQAGLPVPGGFCLTVGAYRRVAEGAGLDAVLDQLEQPAGRTGADQAELANLAGKARAAVAAAPVPKDIEAEVIKAYRALASVDGEEVPVAVRSSATAEDLPFASFAGQQDTYLNVVGVDAVLDAVRRCWASLWTDRAVSYRSSNGIPHREVALAAVVQRMVNSQVSGVMFTANPALLPSARLLRALDYEEAQEIATTGAKVLHPRSIPPLKRHQIPLHVLSTDRPDAPGTVISAAGSDGDPQVKAISSRRGLTLISMETVGMWQEVGFLAEVFACFARHGLSIDAVSTSETNVTVSLDPNAQAIEPAVIRDLLRDLASHCEPRVIAPTASISLVGPGIRGILHELGHLLELFAELSIYLVTQSASDLNLTFFVDEEQSERLVRQLHGRLFGQRTESAFLGPTWSELYGAAAAAASPPEWWQRRREELLDVAAKEAPVYVYDEATLEEAAKALLNLPAVDRVFYSLKANSHPGVLAVFHRLGLSFECVSVPEIEHLLALFPDLDAGDHQQLLFTPNFASREELAQGFALGARVTIDSLYPIVAWPELLAGREIFLRLDPGRGRGHHPYVRTAGVQSKFGLSLDQLLEAAERLARAGARVVGLHAHAGSGIQTPEAWGELAVFLGTAAERFPEVRVLDVGGGLGVPERHGQSPLDLAALDAGLARFKAAYAVHPPKELWLEPGRFLVAPAGVLLARVTQVKRKGEVQYVGVETGMNSLIRPALYGAYHTIVNLTRLHEPATQVAHVVGPICETGDVLGRSRRLAPAAEGDVLLIANAGAYGRVMSSRYNLREPAGERLLGRAAQ